MRKLSDWKRTIYEGYFVTNIDRIGDLARTTDNSIKPPSIDPWILGTIHTAHAGE